VKVDVVAVSITEKLEVLNNIFMGFLYSCLTRKAYENGVKDKFEQEKYA
jgi:hypothetical protein